MIYKNILVAIDGSVESDLAFQKAIKYAKENQSKLFLVHIVETRTLADAYERPHINHEDSYASELMKKYEQKASDNGVLNIETIVESGSPKVKIPKQIAREKNIDLVICGASGMNAVERFLIGSVSEHIVRHSPCDVLVIRNQKEE